MRYYEFNNEKRKPELSKEAIIKQKIVNLHKQADQQAKQSLYMHMYAVDKPHDLFMQEVERRISCSIILVDQR